MEHSIKAVRRRLLDVIGHLRALEHRAIADKLERISNEISYFVEPEGARPTAPQGGEAQAEPPECQDPKECSNYPEKCMKCRRYTKNLVDQWRAPVKTAAKGE